MHLHTSKYFTLRICLLKIKIVKGIYLESFLISLTLSIRGFINFAMVPWRLSRSLCIIALDSPNSPIFPRIACWSLSIEFSILFRRSSMSFTRVCISALNAGMSPTFDL